MFYLPFLVIWGLLAVSVVVLIVWRKSVASNEDDSLHVLNAERVIPQQLAMGHKLDMIDRWGKSLTILTVVWGVAMAAIYMYQVWTATSTSIPGQ